MQPVKSKVRKPPAGEDIVRRAKVAAAALQREEHREDDPEIDPKKLRLLIEDIHEVASENIHLRILAEAARELLAAEFEDDTFFAREKMKAAAASLTQWESQRDGR